MFSSKAFNFVKKAAARGIRSKGLETRSRLTSARNFLGNSAPPCAALPKRNLLDSIVRCADAADVTTTVNFAHKEHLVVAVGALKAFGHPASKR